MQSRFFGSLGVLTAVLALTLLCSSGCRKGDATPDGKPAAQQKPAVVEAGENMAKSEPAGHQVAKAAGPGRVALFEAVTDVSGCLGEPADARGKAAKRGISEDTPELDVEAHSWGVYVRHKLQHACCLEAVVEAEVIDDRVVISEVLSGDACRCLCWSTLETRIGLRPGSYELMVNLYDADSEDMALLTWVEVE